MKTFTKTFLLKDLNADASVDAQICDLIDRMGDAILEVCNAGKLARVTWTISVEAVEKAKAEAAS